jgi:hypothetical protein
VPGSLIAPPIWTPPVVIAAVPGLALGVIGGGVRMPPVQLAAAPAAEERPIRQTGSAPAPEVSVPSKAAPATSVVPVHPRKQARH